MVASWTKAEGCGFEQRAHPERVPCSISVPCLVSYNEDVLHFPRKYLSLMNRSHDSALGARRTGSSRDTGLLAF